MTPSALICTGLLLGLLALSGGAYAGLYCAGRLWSRPSLMRAAVWCYLLSAGLATIIVLATPLATAWKVFIAASGAAYGFIPPVTWRFLVKLHSHPAHKESAA
jgi:hypothetical protein